MDFEKCDIEGVYLISPKPVGDHRGVFHRHFCQKLYGDRGIDTTVMQTNVSVNAYAHTLRGFHYQLAPFQEGKTITVLKGALYDIIVDLRPDSPTFKKWVSFQLTESNKYSIHVPKGCANAFMTLEDQTMVYYIASQAYHPEVERGFRYNDPSFDFEWPCAPKHISDRDANHPDFTVETHLQ